MVCTFFFTLKGAPRYASMVLKADSKGVPREELFWRIWSQTTAAKKLNADAPHREHVAAREGKGPFSPQPLARVHLLRAPWGIGHGTGWLGPSSTSRHHHPGWRRHVDKERPLLPRPRCFTARHSFEDLHTQLRWVARTITTQLTVHPHAIATTFDAHQDAPMVEDPVPLVDTHPREEHIQNH